MREEGLSAPRGPATQEELVDEIEFLLTRLDEIEWSDIDDAFRDFAGHCEPSMSRLRMMIREIRK